MWPFKKKQSFPDISKEFSVKKRISNLDVPVYKKEPILSDLAKKQDMNIPKRAKSPTMPKKFDYLKKDVLLPKVEMPKLMPMEKEERHMAVEKKEGHMFVEIEDYKVVLAKVDMIKNKIQDAEKIMDELTKIRVREEKELDNWHKDLNNIKDKLMEIDNKLFKV